MSVTKPLQAGVDHAELRRLETMEDGRALSAHDLACYRYPGAGQQAERDAFTDGVLCQISWSVHVRGPDEVVAAKSYADAVAYCDKLNSECPDANAIPLPVGGPNGDEDSWRIRALSAEASMAAIMRIEDEKIFGVSSAAPVLPDRGWRPIESAPRDGTLVDLWLYWPEGTRHSRCADAFWSEDEGDWKIGQYFTRQYMEPPSALYWMPLPDAPAEGGE